MHSLALTLALVLCWFTNCLYASHHFQSVEPKSALYEELTQVGEKWRRGILSENHESILTSVDPTYRNGLSLELKDKDSANYKLILNNEASLLIFFKTYKNLDLFVYRAHNYHSVFLCYANSGLSFKTYKQLNYSSEAICQYFYRSDGKDWYVSYIWD